MRSAPRSRFRLGLAAVALGLAVAGCGSSAAAPPAPAGSGTVVTAPWQSTGGGDPAAGRSAEQHAAGGAVTLVTHDSFNVDKKVLADFEKSSGITVTLLAQGDAGAMTNKLVLTKDNPLGDVVFGIDNTFASRALDAGILQPYAIAGRRRRCRQLRPRRRPADRGRLRRRLRQRRPHLVHRREARRAGHLRGSGEARVQGPAGRRITGHLVTRVGLPARHRRALR